jgi:hypothetical protein
MENSYSLISNDVNIKGRYDILAEDFSNLSRVKFFIQNYINEGTDLMEIVERESNFNDLTSEYQVVSWAAQDEEEVDEDE